MKPILKIDKIIAALTRIDEVMVGYGATEEEISEAEKQLSVILPMNYKIFLLKFGWYKKKDFHVYGIGKGVPSYLDLITVTQEEREEMEPPLPPHLVPLMNDGCGNHHCLDTTLIENNDCPTVFWDHELNAKQTPNQLEKSFEDWLSFMLKTKLTE